MRAVKSRISALILIILRSEPASSVQLADYLGLSPSEVNAYLHFWKQRGILEKDGFVWRLTRKGLEYVKNHEEHLSHILSIYRINLHKLESTRIKQDKDLLRLRIKKWSGKIYDECKPLIDFLVEYRSKATYIELPRSRAIETLRELMEEQGISSIDSRSLMDCIVELRARAVIFVIERSGVVKLRLNRNLERGILNGKA